MKKPFRRVLVTAGPTQEMLDPVRYLTNRSTGAMGYAIARAARRAGYAVTLISGPVALKRPAGVLWVPITSAADLKKACQRHFKHCDVLFMTAAVCDFTPLKRRAQKIHRQGRLTLTLRKTPDILAALAAKKRRRIVIGFCLETEDWLAGARRKLNAKHLDGIVANTLTSIHNPFGLRKIRTAFLGRQTNGHVLGPKSKAALAKTLLRWAESLRRDTKYQFLKT